jgi:hypothetical protein
MLAEFLSVFAYVLILAIQFTVKQINFFFALSIPILCSIVSFIIELIILSLTQLRGIPRQYIITYGLLYGVISLVVVYKYWVKTSKKA